ncbi:helix-turn-helix domain-containing protein [Friedmanniella luteola]|uniref:helix-turn-helix domain-containing protein n=1 Tax=Friedmanniella luteola TaxID=546871 RepID=UPI000B84B91C
MGQSPTNEACYDLRPVPCPDVRGRGAPGGRRAASGRSAPTGTSSSSCDHYYVAPACGRDRGLVSLGFTASEARVHVALLQQPESTGYELAKAAGLQRANAYAAVDSLWGRRRSAGSTAAPRPGSSPSRRRMSSAASSGRPSAAPTAGRRGRGRPGRERPGHAAVGVLQSGHPAAPHPHDRPDVTGDERLRRRGLSVAPRSRVTE